MESALSEIEFLALSANRVRVLDHLADGEYSRRELAELTGASQPTLGRILRDFEERAWVSRGAEGYAATATGRLVAEGFADLVDVFETERKLRDVVRWLPTDALGFDLARLASATVTRPSQTRPNAPVRRVLDLLQSAEDVRVFSHAFNEGSLEVIERRTSEGAQTFEGVFSPAAIDALADDARLRERLRALVAADRAEIRISDGEIPLAVTVAGDVVHLLLRDDRGVLQAALESDDETVHEWAVERHAAYWADATPLEPDALDPDAPDPLDSDAPDE